MELYARWVRTGSPVFRHLFDPLREELNRCRKIRLTRRVSSELDLYEEKADYIFSEEFLENCGEH